MSAIVDYSYYGLVYMGQEVDEASFPALCARALDVVGAMTRWRVSEDNFATFHPRVQDLYRKAVCAQIEFFTVNGLDSVTISMGADRGFTVGKVSVSGRSGSELTRGGAMANNIAPMALMYLEQTGLMNPAVPVSPDMPLIGGWF